MTRQAFCPHGYPMQPFGLEPMCPVGCRYNSDGTGVRANMRRWNRELPHEVKRKRDRSPHGRFRLP